MSVARSQPPQPPADQVRWQRPSRYKGPRLTPQQQGFLDLHRQYGDKSRALAAVMASNEDYQDWQTQEDFSTALAAVEETINDDIRIALRTRAVDGWDVPVYQKGMCVGYQRVYNHRLLEVLARARLPEFRDLKSDLTVNTAVAFVPWGPAEPSNPGHERFSETRPAALPAPSASAGRDAVVGADR